MSAATLPVNAYQQEAGIIYWCNHRRNAEISPELLAPFWHISHYLSFRRHTKSIIRTVRNASVLLILGNSVEVCLIAFSVEFLRWGKSSDSNASFVSLPAHTDNSQRLFRFLMEQNLLKCRVETGYLNLFSLALNVVKLIFIMINAHSDIRFAGKIPVFSSLCL